MVEVAASKLPAATAGTQETFDVVVIGGGGAGLAAALEARAVGRSVVLLEKNPKLGGSTAWSIGSISASATPHQLAKGIQDRPEDHWRDMAGFNGTLDNRDNPDLRRVLAEAMPDTFRWLLGHGIRFYGPMPEPPTPSRACTTSFPTRDPSSRIWAAPLVARVSTPDCPPAPSRC